MCQQVVKTCKLVFNAFVLNDKSTNNFKKIKRLYCSLLIALTGFSFTQ